VGNQQQHDQAVAKDGTHVEVAETPAQLLLQTDTVEQRLVDHQSSERGQALILKFYFRNAVGLAMNGGFATFHANGLRWFIGLVWCHQFYQPRGRFLLPQAIFLHHFYVSAGSHFWCSPST
jgi:hypothetical protein